jgi:putative toxin-antitoxin system antitoxin component (TIGR02293 family)
MLPPIDLPPIPANLLDFTAKLPLSIGMPSYTAFQVAEMPFNKAAKLIRTGLPASAFDDAAKVLSVTVDELAAKLGISPRTIRDQRKRSVRLSRDNSEKLVRIARVQRLARKIFTTDEAVSEWLGLAAPALDGAAPVDLLDTDTGAREVEAVLQGIAYGNVM